MMTIPVIALLGRRDAAQPGTTSPESSLGRDAVCAIHLNSRGSRDPLVLPDGRCTRATLCYGRCPGGR